MKEFKIDRFETGVMQGDTTLVFVSVSESLGSIKKWVQYELTLPKRFGHADAEFYSLIEEQLKEADLL